MLSVWVWRVFGANLHEIVERLVEGEGRGGGRGGADGGRFALPVAGQARPCRHARHGWWALVGGLWRPSWRKSGWDFWVLGRATVKNCLLWSSQIEFKLGRPKSAQIARGKRPAGGNNVESSVSVRSSTTCAVRVSTVLRRMLLTFFSPAQAVGRSCGNESRNVVAARSSIDVSHRGGAEGRGRRPRRPPQNTAPRAKIRLQGPTTGRAPQGRAQHFRGRAAGEGVPALSRQRCRPRSLRRAEMPRHRCRP